MEFVTALRPALAILDSSVSSPKQMYAAHALLDSAIPAPGVSWGGVEVSVSVGSDEKGDL